MLLGHWFYHNLFRWSFALCDRIKDEFYRFYPYLCRGARNFCLDHFNHFNAKKEIYIGFTDISDDVSIRSLRTENIGTLIRIKGQVVRTHPVHPELIIGCFNCNDCGAACEDIVQQFKVSFLINKMTHVFTILFSISSRQFARTATVGTDHASLSILINPSFVTFKKSEFKSRQRNYHVVRSHEHLKLLYGVMLSKKLNLVIEQNLLEPL